MSRKAGESVFVEPDITFKVLSVDKGVVKVGIEAPDDVKILRGELRMESDDEQDD